MPLFLVELPARSEIRSRLPRLEAALAERGGELREHFAAPDLDIHYLVLDAPEAVVAGEALRSAELPAAPTRAVRMVGADTPAARASHLVEWDLPEGLAMDDYLARKAAKTPLYAQVPTAAFRRTYVCEDMTKCLCLYDAPDEATVRRAREVVAAPVDRLSRVEADDPVPS